MNSIYAYVRKSTEQRIQSLQRLSESLPLVHAFSLACAVSLPFGWRGTAKQRTFNVFEHNGAGLGHRDEGATGRRFEYFGKSVLVWRIIPAKL